MMEWFNGPVDTIFGMPSYWVLRIAKVIQFLSGLIIVLDILGRDRVNQFAMDMAEASNRMFTGGVIKRHLRASYRTFIYLLKFTGIPHLLGKGHLIKANTEIKLVLRNYLIISLCITGISCFCLYQLNLITSWLGLLQYSACIFLGSVAIIPALFAGILSIAALTVQKIIHPVFQKFATLISKKGVFQPLLIISLLLFIFAFVLDMSVA